MKWQDKLTKYELDHLREQNIRTLRIFKIVAEDQREDREEYSDIRYEPCYDCKTIAIKLGLPV